MLEVNGAYKYDRYERIWLKSEALLVLSSVKVFATQEGQLDWRMNTADDKHPFAPHLDKKLLLLSFSLLLLWPSLT